jgi:hypothetical protein
VSKSTVIFPELEQFKCELRAGKKTRSDWPVWCWICDEPLMAGFGESPLTECNTCREASYELVAVLEATVERGRT